MVLFYIGVLLGILCLCLCVVGCDIFIWSCFECRFFVFSFFIVLRYLVRKVELSNILLYDFGCWRCWVYVGGVCLDEGCVLCCRMVDCFIFRVEYLGLESIY